MWKQALTELMALQKKMYLRMNEVMGITQELDDAVRREDQISVKILLSARQSPILELEELHAQVSLKRCDLSGKDEERFDRLLSGGKPASPEEKQVAEQLAVNHRLLQRLTELDHNVSQLLCRGKSFYQKRR
jgi:hypothetical protein